MAARERGLFSLYIHIENFKNLLVRNHLTDFNLTEMFPWWPSTKIVQAIVIRQKKRGRQGGGGGAGLFFLYIYIENFKNLLFRNHVPISI